MKNRLKADAVKGNYIPTAEEKANIIPSATQFILSGDKVFHTIQGEGNYIGKPVTFVRLHFCDLKCVWCDSWYTRHTGTKEYYSEPTRVEILDLLEMVQKAQKSSGLKTADCKNICFTGGEPLLQQDKITAFMQAYPEYNVQIETNGTIMPNAYLLEHAKFNCSPKLSNSGNKGLERFMYQPNIISAIASTKEPCFKFVCKQIKDFEEIETKFGVLLPKEQIYIMPEGVLIEENIKVYGKIINKIVASGYSTTPRIQNICFYGGSRAK